MGFIYALRSEQEKTKHTSFGAIHFCVPVMGALLFLCLLYTSIQEIEMAIEVFSFFSGLGFMDLGFEEAGFDIAFVNEYNHSFIQAYQYARRKDVYKRQLLHICISISFLM